MDEQKCFYDNQRVFIISEVNQMVNLNVLEQLPWNIKTIIDMELRLGNNLIKVEKIISFPTEEYIEISFAETFKSASLKYKRLDDNWEYQYYVEDLQNSTIIYSGLKNKRSVQP
jgi:hypothetical protein